MMTVEEFHTYLSMVWYDYRCSDKDKVTEIIREELARSDEHKDEDHLKWAVKRRCQAEAL